MLYCKENSISNENVQSSIMNHSDPLLILKAGRNPIPSKCYTFTHSKCQSHIPDTNTINFSKSQTKRRRFKNLSNLMPGLTPVLHQRNQFNQQIKEKALCFKVNKCYQQTTNQPQRKKIRNFSKFSQKIAKQPAKCQKGISQNDEQLYNTSNSLRQRSSFNENVRICLSSQKQTNTETNKENIIEPTNVLTKQQRISTRFLCQKVQLQDFEMGQLLGKGAFGTVHIVRHKKTGSFFAMKTYIKKHILPKLDRFIHCLKLQILATHPNIAQLYTVFADSDKFYELMELCIDGDLSSQSKTLKKASEDTRRKMIKGIIKGIEFLHQNHTIHRDIKLQNILLNYGMPKITDFDLAIYIPNPTQSRRTFCGSPMYFSPEMLTNQCYNSKVDIWSLGIVCYEIVCGHFPFKVDQYNQINNIVNDDIHPFPNGVDQNVKKLIQSMLMKDPQQRACWQEIISHPYFQQCKNP